MQKVDGVEKVEVRLNQGLTSLDLKSGNKITLAQLRSVIRNNGFVSKEATITAAGRLDANAFRVSGTNETLTVAGTLVQTGTESKFVVNAK